MTFLALDPYGHHDAGPALVLLMSWEVIPGDHLLLIWVEEKGRLRHTHRLQQPHHAWAGVVAKQPVRVQFVLLSRSKTEPPNFLLTTVNH